MQRPTLAAASLAAASIRSPARPARAASTEMDGFADLAELLGVAAPAAPEDGDAWADLPDLPDLPNPADLVEPCLSDQEHSLAQPSPLGRDAAEDPDVTAAVSAPTCPPRAHASPDEAGAAATAPSCPRAQAGSEGGAAIVAPVCQRSLPADPDEAGAATTAPLHQAAAASNASAGSADPIQQTPADDDACKSAQRMQNGRRKQFGKAVKAERPRGMQDILLRLRQKGVLASSSPSSPTPWPPAQDDGPPSCAYGPHPCAPVTVTDARSGLDAVSRPLVCTVSKL